MDEINRRLRDTSAIVIAFVHRNALPHDSLAALIGEVHGALARLAAPSEPAPRVHEPAIPVERSITPDALISLIDGKPYQTLKRHLGTHGLTPAEYRSRYDLPADYPMSCAKHSAMRAEHARTIGLRPRRGSGGRVAAPASARAGAARGAS